MIILDASKSMIEEKEKIDGKLKLDLAKESIETIINTPEVSHLEFSLTALGHASLDCKDNIEIFEEKDKDILTALPGIKGGTFTPLADTIKRVGLTFKDKNQKNIIVLLTDGVEFCRKDKNGNLDKQAPFREVSELQKQGFDFVINIITLSEVKEDNAILEELAKLSGGKLYRPDKLEEMIEDVSESVSRFGEIEVKRPKTTTAASIKGWKLYEANNPDAIKHETKSEKINLNLWLQNSVPAQNYRFCMYFEDPTQEPFIKDIEIKTSRITTIDYEKDEVKIKLSDE